MSTLNVVEVLFNHKPVDVHFLSKKNITDNNS